MEYKIQIQNTNILKVILWYFRNNKLKTFDFLKIWRELSLTLLGYFAWRGLAAASKDSYGIQTNICQPQRASDIWNIASIVPPKVKVPILGSIFKMFKNKISWGRAARKFCFTFAFIWTQLWCYRSLVWVCLPLVLLKWCLVGAQINMNILILEGGHYLNGNWTSRYRACRQIQNLHAVMHSFTKRTKVF